MTSSYTTREVYTIEWVVAFPSVLQMIDSYVNSTPFAHIGKSVLFRTLVFGLKPNEWQSAFQQQTAADNAHTAQSHR